jgi:flagellar motor component MotA
MKKLAVNTIIVVLAFVISRIILSSFLTGLIDLWAFVVVPIMPTIYTFILYGFKRSVNSFKIPLKDDANDTELQLSLQFFNNLGSICLYFTGFVVSISIIDMFIKFDEKMEVGPRVAVSLISIFYAVLMHLLIIIPYRGILNKKINSVCP